jgi:fatty acid desaturase
MSSRSLEWPTILLMAATYLVWATGTLIWTESGLLSILLTAFAVAQFSSLQHEVLHGHPFASQAVNEALVFPGLTLTIPYQRFRDTHLAHHHDPILTDPYDDPESNYCDPAVWERLPRPVQKLLRLNNTLVGRILVGPILGNADFFRKEWALIRAGDQAVRRAWVLHLGGLALLLVWLWGVTEMPLLGYVVAVYCGQAVLKIRTYLEHRAHTAFRARTVVVEDRGLLALLFLNNNFHVVHHMHPSVPWYRLPALYAARRAHYLRRNEGYVYASYGEVFHRYLTKSKDPVPHPVWPVKKD